MFPAEVANVTCLVAGYPTAEKIDRDDVFGRHKPTLDKSDGVFGRHRKAGLLLRTAFLPCVFFGLLKLLEYFFRTGDLLSPHTVPFVLITNSTST